MVRRAGWLVLLLLVPWPGRAQFVTAHREELRRNGQPLRLWGVHLSPAASHAPYAATDQLAARLDRLGFNAVVLWGDPSAFVDPDRPGRLPVTRPGDQSPLDRFDYLIAKLAERDILVWLCVPTRLPSVVAEDYVGPPEGRDAWLLAIRESIARADLQAGLMTAQYIDPGLRRARERFIGQLLAHVNPFRRLPYSQDPAIAVLALGDRVSFLSTMFESSWETSWHPYFQESCRQQYLAWLRGRYADDAAWRRAWGEVATGESISGGTVSTRPGIERGGRLRDLITFAAERVDELHGRLIATVRAAAPTGVGANVIPIVSETVAGATWYGLYGGLHGDACATGAYWPHLPLHSALREPWTFCGPRTGASLEVRVAGRPWIVFATGQPPPQVFRAEYPMRVALHASLQNAAGVFFHEWAAALSDRGYNSAPLYDPETRGPYDFCIDNIAQSQMRVAGLLFRRRLIEPMPEPTLFRYGPAVLEDPAYGIGWWRTDSWVRFAATMHRRGAAIVWDRDFAGGEAVGGETFDEPPPRVFEPAPGIRIDRGAQRLTVDRPTAKIAVGQLGERFEFSDGVRLSGLATDFLAFGLVSADGRPVAESNEAWLSAVAGVHNTGFAYRDDGTIAARGYRPLRYRRVQGYLELPDRADRLAAGWNLLLAAVPKVEAARGLRLDGRDLVLALNLVPAESAAGRNGER